MNIPSENPDKPAPENAAALSGLDALQAMIDGNLPGPAIAQLMGFRLHTVEDGRAEFRGVPDASVTNPAGTVHGGWYGTLLDSAMACAVMTKIPAGTTYTTLEYKVNIIRPVPLGASIAAIGLTDHVGRSTGIAHGEIRGLDDDRLYATGSTTCIVMPMSRR